jgi:hypothetical protein
MNQQIKEPGVGKFYEEQKDRPGIFWATGGKEMIVLEKRIGRLLFPGAADVLA